ncbi:hypothetical protein IKJ53_07950 [bacterium]|nr:hypothetical protein [bacterium]
MKITSTQQNNTSFGKIIVPRDSVRSKILKGLNSEQVASLKKDLLAQQDNPVNAIIDHGKWGLKAKLFCQYRLKGFKEELTQKPVVESTLDFVNRIMKKCDEYKKQLIG